MRVMQLAKDIAYTCYQTYSRMPTRLAPEITYFNLAPDAPEDLIVKVKIITGIKQINERVGVHRVKL